jgi:hypothetical protein
MAHVRRAPLPVTFPWSQSFAECCNTVCCAPGITCSGSQVCIQIDKFTRKFYQYTDGLSHSMRNLENQLGQVMRSVSFLLSGR